MNRKFWIVSSIVALVLAMLVAIGGGAYVLRERHQSSKSFGRAEEAFAKGYWPAAKSNYAWYLVEFPDDLEALEKYAHASSQILTSRRRNLADTGRAYFQIAKQAPTQENLVRTLQFYEKHIFWRDLEYTADFFSEQNVDFDQLDYYRAVAIHKQNRTNDAINAYTKLIEAGKATPDIYGNLASLLLEKNFPGQAKNILEKVQQDHPDKAQTFIERAKFALSINEISQASQELDAAMALDPHDVDVQMMATNLALRNKEWEQAAELAEKAIAQDLENVGGYFFLVSACERLGDYDRALALLDQVEPTVLANNPTLFLTTAEIQIAADRLEDARDTTDKFKASYPQYRSLFDYLNARDALAKSRAETDRTASYAFAEEAATQLVTVIEATPSFERAEFYLAIAYLRMYEKSQVTDPKSQKEKDQMLSQTLTTLESYVRKSPNDERALNLYQDLSSDPLTLAETTKKANAILKDDRAQATVLVQMAQSLMSFSPLSDQNQDAVRQLLEKAIEREPSMAEAYQTLASLFVAIGDKQLALQTIEKAEQAQIQPPRLAIHKADVALLEDDHDKAYQIYIELTKDNDLSRKEIIRWANLFASKGHLETGLKILTLGAEKTDGKLRMEFELDRIELCTKQKDTERAITLLQVVEPLVQAHPDSLKRLRREKLFIAGTLLQKGDATDLDKADELIEQVLQSDPEMTAAKSLHARVMLSQDLPDYDKAMALATEVLKADEYDVNALLVLWDNATRMEQEEEALIYAKRALDAAPKHLPALLATADAQMRSNRYSEARDTLESVLQIDPGQFKATEFLVRTYSAMGQQREANELLGELERIASDDPDRSRTVKTLRERMLAREQGPEEMERILTKQRADDLDNLNLAKELAITKQLLGRQKEAEKVMGEFAEQHQQDPKAWTELGRFHLLSFDRYGDRESLDKASSAFAHVQLFMENYDPALRGHIDTQVLMGNKGIALKMCDEYLKNREIQADDLPALHLKAQLLYEKYLKTRLTQEYLNEAVYEINRAIHKSERLEYIRLRGLLHREQGKYPEAIEDLKRFADTQGKTTWEVDEAMSASYHHLKRSNLAQKYYNSAKEKADPKSQYAKERLSQLEKLLNEEGGAT